jgi:hypothetical protein
MPTYISATFEKDELLVAEKTRIIVRNVDQGSVPPAPSATHFPTQPDEFQTFIVGEYVSDVVGENFKRVATLSDLSTYTYSRMNLFRDNAGGVISVLPGDIVYVVPSPTELWVSDEYPSTYLRPIGQSFVNTVLLPIDAFHFTVSGEFPGFLSSGFSWEVYRGVTLIASGNNATLRRENVTYGFGTQLFLEKRFNTYFDSPVAAENFVVASKAAMIALANEAVAAGLTDETFTALPA